MDLISSEDSFSSSIKYLQSKMFQKAKCSQIVYPSDFDQRRRELLKKIQIIILLTVKSVSDDECPLLKLRSRRCQWKHCNFNQRLSKKSNKEVQLQEVRYTTQKKRFDIIFNILAKIYRLLQTKSSMTKRELYYEHTELFGSQATVNAALMDICGLLGATPWELRVFSTSKGLVAGDLVITTADKEVVNCSKPRGVLVPQNVKEIKKIKSSAAFILLVEKDAAFQKLLDEGAHLRFAPCIIITGKGEPDINTRLLVHRLCQELAIPVFIVVDADPYGIEIMCTYRFGSLSLSEYSQHLAVAEVRWVGIHPTDIAKFCIPTVPLTPRDFVKARDLASRPYIFQNQELLEQLASLVTVTTYRLYPVCRRFNSCSEL
ncbi:meiotic recombination protein SPO11 isoform X2 [Homalodisca vitripennis]|uniref:meiotic recombination protein SPO11 isoform X2 n=1 Tax=Homalodisca vitripennis TaxID=197043 RepID=UPI001EE9E2A7|nr:meiotic recombination protein SPO11 isoform X2 [Homalodisca vitripennis]